MHSLTLPKWLNTLSQLLNCYLISIPSCHAEKVPGIDELYLTYILLNNKKSIIMYTNNYKAGIIEEFVNRPSLAKMEVKYQRWPKLVGLDGPNTCFKVKSRASWGEKCPENAIFSTFYLKEHNHLWINVLSLDPWVEKLLLHLQNIMNIFGIQ